MFTTVNSLNSINIGHCTDRCMLPVFNHFIKYEFPVLKKSRMIFVQTTY